MQRALASAAGTDTGPSSASACAIVSASTRLRSASVPVLHRTKARAARSWLPVIGRKSSKCMMLCPVRRIPTAFPWGWISAMPGACQPHPRARSRKDQKGPATNGRAEAFLVAKSSMTVARATRAHSGVGSDPADAIRGNRGRHPGRSAGPSSWPEYGDKRHRVSLTGCAAS